MNANRTSTTSAADSNSVSNRHDADEAHDSFGAELMAIQALDKNRESAARGPGRSDRFRAIASRDQEIIARCLALFDRYPDDPRRFQPACIVMSIQYAFLLVLDSTLVDDPSKGIKELFRAGAIKTDKFKYYELQVRIDDIADAALAAVDIEMSHFQKAMDTAFNQHITYAEYVTRVDEKQREGLKGLALYHLIKAERYVKALAKRDPDGKVIPSYFANLAIFYGQIAPARAKQFIAETRQFAASIQNQHIVIRGIEPALEYLRSLGCEPADDVATNPERIVTQRAQE